MNINTYILKSFNEKQQQLFIDTLNYISKNNKINNNIKLINNLDIEINEDDFLILIIDELTLNRFITDFDLKTFFENKIYSANRIILVLNDINFAKLPEYMQFFRFFILSSYNELENENIELSKVSDYRIVEIVTDIIFFIKKIKKGLQKNIHTVYICPADGNTTLEYQKIIRELLHREYNLLPEIVNPKINNLKTGTKDINPLLKKTDLSIHFIGHKSLIDYPEKESYALKINNIAADFCKTNKDNNLQRIVYVPPENEYSNELLIQKISLFKNDINALYNAELIQTPVEKFKDVILQKLHDLDKKQSNNNTDLLQHDDIYIIYQPECEDETNKIQKLLQSNGITIAKSQVNLDQLELLNYHQNKLTTCKGVIIFYNNKNKDWIKRKLSDIKKAPGWGRKTPFKVKILCGLNNKNNLTNNIDTNSYLLFENNCELNISDIKKMLSN
jgi:hypothetical protein